MKVGEVRRLVCESVNVMALAATATSAVRHDVERVLGMPLVLYVMMWKEYWTWESQLSWQFLKLIMKFYLMKTH